MSIPEELGPPSTSEWHRHIFHVPPAADWVPAAFEKLKGVPALPSLRAPRREHNGGISVEENHPSQLVPLVVLLNGRPLWPEKPIHLMLLDPDTPDVLQAAAIVDTAAMRGKLTGTASAWPLSGLRAALHNYAPSLRAISVLMQKNPQASLPLPLKEEILKSLVSYRRYLGDLPPEPEPQPPPAGETVPAETPAVPSRETQPGASTDTPPAKDAARKKAPAPPSGSNSTGG